MAEQYLAIWPAAHLRGRTVEAKVGCFLFFLDVTSLATAIGFILGAQI